MDPAPGLSALRDRKRELLVESELNRQLLRVEVGRIRFQTERLKRGYGWAHGAWKWVAPIAGFLFARALGSLATTRRSPSSTNVRPGAHAFPLDLIPARGTVPRLYPGRVLSVTLTKARMRRRIVAKV